MPLTKPATPSPNSTGRRKEASARVRLMPGSGQMFINGRPIAAYLTRPALVKHAEAPLDATIFELTFGEELNETRYRWHAQAPEGWAPLVSFATRLIRLVDEPAGVAAR